MTAAGRPRVSICEVGPRDGLQNEPEVLAPAVRAELVAKLAATGVERVEAVSFVSDRRVPAMAGAEEVVATAAEQVGEAALLAGLVLNERGYDRLRATALREVHLAFAATETFNARNQNATPLESVAELGRVISRAHDDGRRATATIGASFGCPFEGEVDPGWVLELAGLLAEAGADEIVFADTIGVGVPRQVRSLATGAAGLGVPLGVHLHNTRNTGYANAFAAVEAGVTVLDASVGGIGGCPFAPRATGNIATEDLVYLLDREGVETGIDLDALIAVSEWLELTMGKQLPGQLHRVGRFPS